MSAGPLSRRACLFLALAAALVLPACGGGSTGGAGPDGAGQGLLLVNFFQSSQDNVSVNQVLRFDFSEPVDPGSIGRDSIQIRQGDAFGLTAAGELTVDGATVFFEPDLPGLCDGSDAGLKAGTIYRVTVVGSPEQFSVKNTKGQALDETVTYEFSTRSESDPELFADQIPATPPAVRKATPSDSEAAVTVNELNEVVVEFTENLDPCSVNSSSVVFRVFEAGGQFVENEVPADEPNAGNKTGFTPWDDQTEDDPYTWGSNTGEILPTPRGIPARLELIQNFSKTELVIRPDFGGFPENALCVVELTFGIRDFGGSPLSPTAFAFTTENLPPQESSMRVEFEQSTEPWPQEDRTLDIDTARSPSLAQAWLQFTGDGDNGGDTDTTPAWPEFPMPVAPPCDKRMDDGTKDDFEPLVNTTLNTGDSRVPLGCANEVDASRAVVWEFATFKINDGITVTIIGDNPAIILVQGEVLISTLGTLRLRGTNGKTPTTNNTAGAGGTAVAGGGPGGKGGLETDGTFYGTHGSAGYGSPSWDTPTEVGGVGAGHGGVDVTYTRSTPALQANTLGNSGGGGGGGHGSAGNVGQTVPGLGNPLAAPADSAGGVPYVDSGDGSAMMTPSAGAGGGGSGSNYATDNASASYTAGGSGGGGGGGFVDFTAGGNIRIYGTIDARGGNGVIGGVDTFQYGAAGGSGGGAGGGIRLLTPSDIDVQGGRLLAGGGLGGPGRTQSGNGWATPSGPQNAGGTGGNGRIVLETGSGSILNFASAVEITPGEGDGFHTDQFNSGRFQGGGLEGVAISGPMPVGPLSPVTFIEPEETDFLAHIPSDAAILPQGTSILIEAAGYPSNADGSPDLTGGDFWFTVGYFSNSGAPSEPSWTEGENPPDVPVGNAGSGITPNLDGSAYLRFRIRMFVPDTLGVTEGGPYLDYMDLRFTYDQ